MDNSSIVTFFSPSLHNYMGWGVGGWRVGGGWGSPSYGPESTQHITRLNLLDHKLQDAIYIGNSAIKKKP